mmetsp:Transcript_44794/g.105494  ORF Transcript_44794/g.105494 Transcript_44794/m.105494 type:complete len:311 (-) Transcript_44794:169-1101(-)
MGPSGEGWKRFTLDEPLDIDLDADEMEESEESGDVADGDEGEQEAPRKLMKEFEYNEAPSTKRRLTKDERERKLQALRGMHGGVTASHLPGTTLGLTELSLDNGHSLFDTPGLIVDAQITNRLLMDELAAVLPQKRVEHVTYRVPGGSCVHLGGFARIELVSDRPFFFTIFVGNQVSMHVGKSATAEEFRQKHTGKMLTPPFNSSRLDEIGPLFETEINSYGLSWDRACTDVVLAGLGWVALTGLGDVTVRVLAPEGVGVMQREPLMPFEARTSTESYKGSGDKRGTSRRTKSLQFANPRRGRGYGSPSR